ncbi:LOW QUALITY PROTEIN: hypothetical protein QYF61_010110 [Mycteria americana]|uniref:Histone H2A n=1 Tax=Mycteria americana TaxID=33587 RepID=A0AAN7Q0P5_MYCAM|nr:LOW QUALITY PROTEIN: hypothetical protein QYF61_010110 [Mycteria americana]
MKLPFAGHLEKEEVKIKMSCSSRAGLAVSVSHKDRQPRKGQQAACIGAGAPVCLAPVLQYLAYETTWTRKFQSKAKQHFSPWHILQTVKRYSQLKKLLAGITIYKAGAHQRKKSVASPLKKRNIKQLAIRRIAYRSVTFKCKESRNSCPTLARQGKARAVLFARLLPNLVLWSKGTIKALATPCCAWGMPCRFSAAKREEQLTLAQWERAPSQWSVLFKQ